jgi:TatD DNase family protein
MATDAANPMWIDAHAHLSDLSDRAVSELTAGASAAGISCVINTAVDLETGSRVIAQCRGFPLLRAAVGISPFDVVGLAADWPDRLRLLAASENVVGIGEIGIDASNPRYPPLGLQMPVFERQLTLARDCNLPAIIHSRGIEADAIAACRSAGVQRALFHCFTGDKGALQLLLDAGYFVSFSGIITFGDPRMRELVEYAPVDRSFIETDAPYLAPVPHRGKKNQPAWVALTGQKAAEFKRMDPGDFAAAVRRNFEKLFGVCLGTGE